jgi:hypothetical protein
MRSRNIRIPTAIVIVALCAFAVSRGWSIVLFSTAKAGLTPSENSAGVLAPWTKVPGVAIAALEASATPVSGPSDQQGALKRIDELTAVLSLRPMSSTNWLSLASMRLVTGQPPGKVLSALAMSSMTGPNENSIMFQRGIFGLLEWETLPNNFRKRTIVELAGTILGGAWGDSQRRAVVGVLDPKSAETRKEIGDFLRAAGVPDEELGLLIL